MPVFFYCGKTTYLNELNPQLQETPACYVFWFECLWSEPEPTA